MGCAMPALPRVRMECTLSTGVMEIGLVAIVRPVAAALLATTCVRDTGAVAPTGDVVGEEVLLAAAPMVVTAEGELGALGPARDVGDRSLTLNDAGGDVGGLVAP
jgi:hypothetical protein